jgi:NDP-sugar pyrophosphorylase family protein
MPERAVVLAAGRGSRLGALTTSTPKPLLDVGGIPIIERILDGVASVGIHEVGMITGYLADTLEDAVWGMGGLSIEFIRQPEPNGTGGALLLAKEFTQGQPFFFTWGDVLVGPGNYGRVLEASGWADAVIAINQVDDPAAGAAVYVDDAYSVERIVEKPAPGTSKTRWNNAGFGLLGPAIWPYLESVTPSARGEIELPDALTALIEAGGKVRAVPVEGRWFDIGTPESLQAARAHFTGT